jgi:hypothetical protein
MAMKIESKAAYIGTVMNELTDLRIDLVLTDILRMIEASRVEGGDAGLRRKDPGVSVPCSSAYASSRQVK